MGGIAFQRQNTRIIYSNHFALFTQRCVNWSDDNKVLIEYAYIINGLPMEINPVSINPIELPWTEYEQNKMKFDQP